MSRKNRAFALAVATAALVGVSAPMASAASFDGPDTNGINNNSLVNVSGNQVPVQACALGAALNAPTSLQALSGIASVLPRIGTGEANTAQGSNCNQDPAQTRTSTSGSSSSQGTTNGVNNNSLVNVSGNQVPVQACAVGAALNAVTSAQALSGLLSYGPVVGTGKADAMQGSTCTQGPIQTNATANT
jgi:hypothetical protein